MCRKSKNSLLGRLNQTNAVGKRILADLEIGFSFALKVIGRENLEEPIERLAQLLLA